MSDGFYKRLSTVAGFFPLAGLFFLMLFVANLEIKDLDLWLHIGMGRFIVENGYVPPVDVLSCTIAGKPWVNHEWLFQIIVYFIDRLWGPDGLITMQMILVAVTMSVMFVLGYNKKKQLASIFMLLMVSLVYETRFTIRPDLYSLFFFAVYILVLSFFLERRWSLYVLFAVQVLWSNMHGFFFFGPLFVLMALAAEWMKRHLTLPYEWNKAGRLSDQEYRWLKYILGAVVVACFFNPLTVHGAWYPISVMFQISGESRIFFDKIVELQRPVSWNNLFSAGENGFYKLMIIVSAVSFVFNRRKLDLSVFFLWLFFLLFSLAAMRNMVFFAFAAYLAFAVNIMSISLTDIVPIRVTDRKFVHLLSIITKILLMAWILQYFSEISMNGYYDFDRYERKSEFGGIAQRSFPNKAVDFLVANQVRGNFFNDFNSGAYMAGRCHPDIKVFIDGRTEVYGPEFFNYYRSVWEKKDTSAFAEMLDKYKMTGVFLNSVSQPIPDHALRFLDKSPEWAPVYFDYDGVIFLKDVPENKDVIQRNRLDFRTWQPKLLDLYRLGSSTVTPYHFVNRAYTLMSLELYELAVAEAREALRISPNYLEPYKIIGKSAGHRKDFQTAFEYFRIAVTFESHNADLRGSLGRSLYDLGQYSYAVRQYQRAMELDPSTPKYHYNLAQTYVKMDQPQKAMETLRQAARLDPGHTGDVLFIGDMFLSSGDFDSAREAYELALQQNDKEPKVYLKQGRLEKKLGKLDAAREQFTKGLALDPENDKLKEALENLDSPEDDAAFERMQSEEASAEEMSAQ